MSDKKDIQNWEQTAKNLLKSVMIQYGFNYDTLSERMGKMGVRNASGNNLKSKINRGSFSATFLLQALVAMGCDEISIKNLPVRKRFDSLFNVSEHSTHPPQRENHAVHETPADNYHGKEGGKR